MSSSSSSPPITNKKRKLDEDTHKKSDDDDDDENDTSLASSSSTPSPTYGSKEYWEQRYEKNRASVENGDENKNKKDSDDTENNDPSSMHAWYFSYEDLKPLILPLLLGGDDDDENDETKNDKEKNDDSNNKKGNQARDSDNHSNSHDNGDDDDSDVFDNEEQPSRPGVIQQGVPISVLEVGCGDVPLGTDLANDLVQLETEQQQENESNNNGNGNKKPKLITKEVICCDYSESVIDLLKQKYKEKNGNATAATGDAYKKNKVVNFVVADARQMEYTNGQFHLILEKGTLDAMLCDKEEGIENCKQIVTECARVLAIGGYIVIISHLNANTKAGIDWLNDVVVPGLRAGGRNDASWEIEVHGSNDIPDGEFEEEEEEEEDDDDDRCDYVPVEKNLTEEDEKYENNSTDQKQEDDDEDEAPEGPGPAVYIIHKMPSENSTSKDGKTDKPSADEVDEDSEPPTIPLKFFSY